MIDFNNKDIDSYRNQLMKICKQLGQWKFLTKDEQMDFRYTKDRKYLERLMTTSRIRSMR